MKVKIIFENLSFELQNKINDFIKDKQIIDIKFMANATTTKYALIMYEEQNKECNEDEKLKAEYTRGFMDERTTWQDKIKKEIELHRKNIVSWGTGQNYRDNVIDAIIKQEKYVIDILNELLNIKEVENDNK